MEYPKTAETDCQGGPEGSCDLVIETQESGQVVLACKDCPVKFCAKVNRAIQEFPPYPEEDQIRNSEVIAPGKKNQYVELVENTEGQLFLAIKTQNKEEFRYFLVPDRGTVDQITEALASFCGASVAPVRMVVAAYILTHPDCTISEISAQVIAHGVGRGKFLHTNPIERALFMIETYDLRDMWGLMKLENNSGRYRFSEFVSIGNRIKR